VDIRGVVVRERGGSPRVEHLQLGDAGPGEVLVRILASGVCHSDVHYQLGGSATTFRTCSDTRGRGASSARKRCRNAGIPSHARRYGRVLVSLIRRDRP
jgi:Alcohol dehydrogenase GroES-like domain